MVSSTAAIILDFYFRTPLQLKMIVKYFTVGHWLSLSLRYGAYDAFCYDLDRCGIADIMLVHFRYCTRAHFMNFEEGSLS